MGTSRTIADDRGRERAGRSTDLVEAGIGLEGALGGVVGLCGRDGAAGGVCVVHGGHFGRFSRGFSLWLEVVGERAQA